MSLCLSTVDDLRNLPVSGCLSVRVHPAAPENFTGLSEVVDDTLLWPWVTHNTQYLSLSKIKKALAFNIVGHLLCSQRLHKYSNIVKYY